MERILFTVCCHSTVLCPCTIGVRRVFSHTCPSARMYIDDSQAHTGTCSQPPAHYPCYAYICTKAHMFYEHTGRGYSANKHRTEITTQRNAAPCSTTHGRACCSGHDPQKTAHKREFGSDAPAIEEYRTWPSLRADGGACVCMCVRSVQSVRNPSCALLVKHSRVHISLRVEETDS